MCFTGKLKCTHVTTFDYLLTRTCDQVSRDEYKPQHIKFTHAFNLDNMGMFGRLLMPLKAHMFGSWIKRCRGACFLSGDVSKSRNCFQHLTKERRTSFSCHSLRRVYLKYKRL